MPEPQPAASPTSKPVPKRKRNILKAFRINEEELAGFEEMCVQEKLSGGDLFRTKCCAHPAIKKKKVIDEREKLLAQNLGRLGRWGNNLNQIAKAVNLARLTGSSSQVVQVLLRHEAELKAMHEALDESRDQIIKALSEG